MSWSAPTTGTVTGYNVYRSTTSGGPYSVVDADTALLTFTDSTVSNGTTYYYVVTALESAVEGPASAEVSATPVAAAVWSEAPQGDWVGAYGADGFVLAGWDVGADLVDLPAGVSVSLDQGTRYRWNANTTDVRALAAPDEVTRRATIWYHPDEVQAGLTFTDGYSGTIRLYSLDWDTATRRQTVSVTTATDGLQSVAIDASFNGGAWVEFTITVNPAETISIAVTHDGGAPHAVLSGIFLGGPTAGAPLSVAAVSGVGLVDVSWTAPTTGTVTGYNVYRSETTGGPYSVVDADTALLNFSDTTVSNGTTYYYVVTALVGAVEGPASAEVSATPTAGDVGWSQGVQGEWVGQYGADGFVLAGWDDGADLVDLPAGVSVSLDQGTRYRWNANTDDVRALEAPDEATHRATLWYHPVEVQAGLTFTDGYTGTLRLYSVDWDTATRRQTVTVTTATNGAQSAAIDASFNGGAWVEVSITANPAETITIAVTHDGGATHAVLSGIFLGGATAGAPLSVGAVAGAGQVDVSWTAPTTGTVTGYNVYRSETTGGPYSVVAADTALLTYSDTTVVNGTTYYYVVTALEGAVEGPASDEVSATPTAAPVWSEAPQGDWIGAYGADGFVLAGWDVGADLDGLPAGVSVSLDQGTRYRWNPDTTDVRALASPDETTRRATIWYHPDEVQAGLTFASGYSGTIRLYSLDWDTATRRQTVTVTTATDGPQSVAIDSSFNGGAWVEFSITVDPAETITIAVTHDGGAPHAVLSGIFLGGPTAGAPLSVAAVAGNGLVDVSWTAPTTGTVTGYNVYRSETSGGPYSVVDADTALLAFTDNTVSNDTTYYYVVTALESAVEGPASDEVSATPTAPDVGWSQGVQGEWVGQYGADGLVLAGWDVAADLVDLPAGVSLSLDQGSRYRWDANTDDVRALEAPDEATHRATTWYHPVEVQAGLTFTDPYSGTIRLYSVDWDQTTRRQTVSVTTATNGVQSAAIDASFNGGAWVEISIDVLALETITIAVTHDGGAVNAVLSGIFLGGPTAGAPLSVAAVPGDGFVDVSWAAPTTGTVTGYNVYRSETSGGPYTVVDADTALLTFTDNTVTNGITYYYVVTALESTVEGPDSDEVGATPLAP